MSLPLAFHSKGFEVSLRPRKHLVKLVLRSRSVELEARRRIGPSSSRRFESISLGGRGVTINGSEMSEGWTEHDSNTFLRDADCFVPDRELVVDSICRLIPALSDSDLVVELCCGDGALSEAILDRVECVRVLALDASDVMLDSCARRTERFGDRIEIRRFDLGQTDWRRFDEPPRAIVSSFAIHHLPDSAKRELFRDMADTLAAGGVLAIADLIQPSNEASTRLAAWQWDEAVRERSMQLRGDLSGFAFFAAERWNHHALEDPDPIDQPAPLLDQLGWLSKAGLEDVDVHWSKGGMSLFSAVRPAT